MRYFSSDLHFQHFNVIAYCDRPYGNLYHMNESLISNWNERISNEDEVFVLGDFTLSTKNMEEFTPRLKGKLHLICGNHDGIFRNDKHLERYTSAGWSIVPDLTTLKLGEFEVILSHFPFKYDPQEKYHGKRPNDPGNKILLHGHCHSNKEKFVRKTAKNSLMIDVGVDGHDYYPWSENELIELIRSINA